MGGGRSGPRREVLVIVLPIKAPEDLIQSLCKDYPHLRVLYHRALPDKSIPEWLYREATILFTTRYLPADPKKDAPHLRLIHEYVAGVNWMVHHPVYKDPNITITTSSGVHGPQIAEWAVMTALVQSKMYNTLYEKSKEHHWNISSRLRHDLLQTRDKVGQRVGILGYGSVGRQIARVARAMGMEVVAYTARERKTKESKKDQGYVVPGTGDPEGDLPSEWYSGTDKKSLHRFLGADLDWLVVAVPLTPATKHLLGAPEFKILSNRMAFLTNIARGPILNQDDLIAALANEPEALLLGAALDVTDPEPLPPSSPLWKLPNVTITPHVSGYSANYTERSFDILRRNIQLLEDGKGYGDLINVVDKDRGY
ncbi:MAG: hypothetical protein M1831_000873 [Alyxoria varia]|nr:MAG: hypothetical protein M1831_000873 [Alyxoria varia]